MPDCVAIDPLVTRYVDGEIADADRLAVERHLGTCPPCRARLGRERAVRDLVDVRRSALRAECAPGSLRTRCAPSRGTAPPARGWRTRVAPLALAATLVLVVGSAFIYPLLARSSRLVAAELALDHVKCSLFNAVLGTHESRATIEADLASDFDWPVRLPEQPERAGLELVGERTCLYGEGRVAHVMFRHEGRTVSMFMLPDDVRKEEVVNVLGHHAAIWSVGGRTFVLVGREPREELQRMASFVRAGLR